ncbi:MAG TPA: acyltransferase domain-containing protein, partial [Polyangiaceae bacterium]|nr:acyltransferase domain-containing protein [Polyangiaceae bacterium]
MRAAGAELVVLSADSSAALAAKAKEVARDCAQPGMLKWLAATSRGSALFEHRLSIVADSDGDLAQKLNQAAQLIESKPNQALSTPNGIHVGWGRPEGRLAFVFPGQGSQYIDMGADLAMHFSAALAAWDTAAEIVRDGDLRLQEVVFPRTAFDDAVAAEQARRLSDTEWAQPAIGCSSLSLLNLIGELELKPSCVAGHSFGEVTALHAAGVLDASQMLRVARRRGELMAEAAVHPGVMCAVPRPLDEVRALLEKFGENVVVANHNGPAQVVLSGITSAIEAVEAKLAAEGIQARRLPVATAFHSEVVADASAGLSAFLTEQSFATASLPVYSNTLAGPYPEAPEKIRALLAEQLARPVQFVGMIEAMYADGVRTFVEVGPGAVLTGLIKGILEGHPHQAVSLDRKGVSSRTALLDALGALVAAGHSLRLEALWSDYAAASDPRTVAKPKLSIGLDGANYGKPYPPPGGAQQLPRPNGPRPEVARVAAGQSAGSVAPQAPSQSAAPNEGAALTAPSNGAGRAAASNGGGVAFDGKALIPVAPPVAVAAAPLNAAGSPMSHRAEPGWAHAYQEAQRHTAEAHSAYMAAMAQSHMAFLQTIEHGFGAISGLPLPVTPTLQPMASALAAPPPAPAPAPTHAAPPTHPPAPAASVAPVVVPPPAAVERTRPAAAAVPVRDLHGLMLQIVSDKTGYPTEMLSAEMQLEGDLGIDSIKRVEILSAMRERAPELPEVDTAVMAKLQTLGEIVEYMQGLLGSVPADAAPSVSVSPAQPAAAVRDLHGLMLQIVSDKTGYPTEMLSA